MKNIVDIMVHRWYDINFAIEPGGKFWIKIKKSFDKYSDICYIIQAIANAVVAELAYALD